ncbi:hypothetical protein [Chitinophaga sp.]|uniref:hypothetical protein n=1 Tax=Chitinophaga sp. TaxID=1869181 RepID=UPI002F92122E
MKRILAAFLLLTFLPISFSFATTPIKNTGKASVSRARIHAHLQLSQRVAGIDVNIPTALYTVTNLNTSANGTVYNSNLYDVEVQEGDVLYLNTLGLLPSISYTVTAADIDSEYIHVSILSL